MRHDAGRTVVIFRGWMEMADERDLLFSKAFLVVPGPQYNEVSQQLRESQNLFFYEVILHPDTPWESMRDRVYPALARFLKYKSISPELGSGVVVALFFQNRFHLLAGSEFLATYAEIEGLDPEAFHSRVLDWLSEPERQEGTEEKGGFRPDLPAVRK